MKMKLIAVSKKGMACALLHCLLLPCLLVVSCARKEAVRPSDIEPYTGPVTVEVLKQSIGFRDIKTIKALTDVRVFRNGEPESSFSGAFGYRAPGDLRTSIFGPFGLTVMDLVMAKDILQLYLPSKDTLYESIMPEISLHALLDSGFSYRMEEQNSRIMLFAFRDGESGQKIVAEYLFDREYLLNRSIVFYREGSPFIRVDFDDFLGSTPLKTRISLPNGIAIDLSLQEPEFDAEIPDDYFRPLEHGDKKIEPFQSLLKRLEPRP